MIGRTQPNCTRPILHNSNYKMIAYRSSTIGLPPMGCRFIYLQAFVIAKINVSIFPCGYGIKCIFFICPVNRGK